MPCKGVERRAYRVRKFVSSERSQELDAQVGRAGAGEGLSFNFEMMTRIPNTFDAHRLLWLAGERGVQDAVAESLFQAYFADGRDLADRATLTTVAAGAGVSRPEVDELLSGDARAAEVRAGEEWARGLGVSGVPFFVVNGRVTLAGAQPPEIFRQAFEQASEELGASKACDADPAADSGGVDPNRLIRHTFWVPSLTADSGRVAARAPSGELLVSWTASAWGKRRNHYGHPRRTASRRKRDPPSKTHMSSPLFDESRSRSWMSALLLTSGAFRFRSISNDSSVYP
jgi:predicted DsbA family dithiol-disulfide isomerase